jgi:hypothetical protein
MVPVKRSVQIRSAMSQRHDCLLDVWEMVGPVGRDVEQRPLTVYSRALSRGILRMEQIQGGYVAAANRLGCLVLHLVDDSSSLRRLCLPIDFQGTQEGRESTRGNGKDPGSH